MAQKQKFKDKKKQQPAPPSKPVEKVVPKQEPVKQPEIPVAKQEPVKPVEKIQPKDNQKLKRYNRLKKPQL